MTIQASEEIATQFANASINKRIWGDILYNVRLYGARGNGLSDDTSKIQSAFNDGAKNGVPVFFPSGVYMITQLVIPNGLRIVGAGPHLSIIKRINNATNTQFALLRCDSGSNIEIVGIGIDGNRNNVSTSAHNIILSACSNYKLSNIRCYNARGIGAFFQNGTNDSNRTNSVIDKCRFDNNAEDGLSAVNEEELIVSESKFSNNNVGASFNLLARTLTVTNCESSYNEIHGLVFYGHKDNDPAQVLTRHVIVSNNQVHDNKGWGISVQSGGCTVTGNVIRNNGTTAAHAGLLMNGVNITATANHIEGNYGFGIDPGDVVQGVISANTIVNNGNAAGVMGTGINVESSEALTISNNYVARNGSSSGGFQIIVRGTGAGNYPLRGQFSYNIMVLGNQVVVDNAVQRGIFVNTYTNGVIVADNLINGASSTAQALQFECFKDGKVYNNFGPLLSDQVVPSASSIIIPDTGEFIFVSGTTAITQIDTSSSAKFKQKVSRIELISPGSGYTSAPTVTISGGGGSGASAHAEIYNGQIMYIELDGTLENPTTGSGYTSSPTVTISGGGGSGASAHAFVGCDNFQGRRILLKFQDAVTLSGGGNLNLVGGSFAATANSQLVLVGAYGYWYEVSRATA